MKRKICVSLCNLWIVFFLAILSVSPAFAAPSASSATVSNVKVATGARDWNGNGIIDAFEDFSGNGTPDTFEDFNGNGTPDAFEDFNGNGTPDAFEDFNGSGTPDAFEDFNGNGKPDAFEDFNGNGKPDAFEDFNGNGIPDAFEDFNGNGTPDAFEDFNGNGMPDAFESKGPLVPYNTNTQTFGSMAIAVHDNANPVVRVSGFRTYHGTSYRLNWSAFLAGSLESAGVIYRVDQDRDRLLQLNDMDGYLDRASAQGLDVTLTNNTCYYIHVAPIRATDASIDRANETVVRISRDARRPHVRSPTHEVQTLFYAVPNVNMEFACFHLDSSSVAKYYFVWDNHPHTEPTKASPSVTDYNRSFIFQPDGTYYFHIRAEDQAGSLSETAHFQVNIGARPPLVAVFNGSPTSGVAPLTVHFTNESTGEIAGWAWDFDGNGTTDSTLQLPQPVVYNEPGTFSVRLTVTGVDGSNTLTRANYIHVASPPPPVAEFSAAPLGGNAPLQVTFTDASTGVITARTWDFGDGSAPVVNPASPIRHTYAKQGRYTVRLTVTGPGGADTRTRSNYIDVLNGIPVVAVAQQQIFLKNMGEMATLDASPSHDPEGGSLFFSWREFYGNPHHGLIPIAADSLSKLNLYFPSPGRYEFEVRVSDGKDMSEETRTITVYVPGRKGLIGFTPSDSIVRVPDARVRVHQSAGDAQNNVNPVDIAISDSMGRYTSVPILVPQRQLVTEVATFL